MKDTENEEYEVEVKPRGPWAGWVVLLLVCLAMLAWGMLMFRYVPDPPRQWDFGAYKDVPGESIYSTGSTPMSASAPAQLPPLPEADTSTGQTVTGPTHTARATQPATRQGGRP